MQLHTNYEVRFQKSAPKYDPSYHRDHNATYKLHRSTNQLRQSMD